MSDAEWYYAEEGEQQGPVSLAELRRLVAAKRVQPDDLVWCEGMEDWLPSSEVAALNAVSQKPKPVRKPEPVEPKAEEPQAAAAESKKPPKDRPKPRPSKEVVATTGAASRSLKAPEEEDEDTPSEPDIDVAEEDDFDEVDQMAAELFAPPKFPARRPKSFERESRRSLPLKPEVIREVTHEVVVVGSGDAQLSTGALILQLLCWAICGLIVIVLAGLTMAKPGNLSNFTEMLLPASIAGFVFCRSVQRCLEILVAMKRR